MIPESQISRDQEHYEHPFPQLGMKGTTIVRIFFRGHVPTVSCRMNESGAETEKLSFAPQHPRYRVGEPRLPNPNYGQPTSSTSVRQPAPVARRPRIRRTTRQSTPIRFRQPVALVSPTLQQVPPSSGAGCLLVGNLDLGLLHHLYSRYTP